MKEKLQIAYRLIKVITSSIKNKLSQFTKTSFFFSIIPLVFVRVTK